MTDDKQSWKNKGLFGVRFVRICARRARKMQNECRRRQFSRVQLVRDVIAGRGKMSMLIVAFIYTVLYDTNHMYRMSHRDSRRKNWWCVLEARVGGSLPPRDLWRMQYASASFYETTSHNTVLSSIVYYLTSLSPSSCPLLPLTILKSIKNRVK